MNLYTSKEKELENFAPTVVQGDRCLFYVNNIVNSGCTGYLFRNTDRVELNVDSSPPLPRSTYFIRGLGNVVSEQGFQNGQIYLIAQVKSLATAISNGIAQISNDSLTGVVLGSCQSCRMMLSPLDGTLRCTTIGCQSTTLNNIRISSGYGTSEISL